MPRKARKKGGRRWRGRRKWRKGRRNAGFTMGMSNQLGAGGYSPIRRTTKANFVINQQLNLDAIAGTPATFLVRANDISDPFPSIGPPDPRPRGVNQLLGTLYDHFVVIGSSIEVTFHNTDTTQGQIVLISQRDSTAVETTMKGYMEDSHSRYEVCSDATAGQSTKTIKMNMNPPKFLGRSKPLADPELKGSLNNTPDEIAFYHIAVGALDLTVNPVPVQCNILVRYIAILFEPTNPPPSDGPPPIMPMPAQITIGPGNKIVSM